VYFYQTVCQGIWGRRPERTISLWTYRPPFTSPWSRLQMAETVAASVGVVDGGEKKPVAMGFVGFDRLPQEWREEAGNSKEKSAER
jgi:hypothetical protein